jgi:large subunit ribosomal protein L13
MQRKEDVKERKWYLINAQGKTLGRLSTFIATLLMGKNKPTYTPHVDAGAGVIVINAEKIKVTGKKLEQKFYKRFSGYPHGLKLTPLKEKLKKRPDEVITHAVKGMLPKNKLARRMIVRLKVYRGEEHFHSAQKPIPIEVKA